MVVCRFRYSAFLRKRCRCSFSCVALMGPSFLDDKLTVYVYFFNVDVGLQLNLKKGGVVYHLWRDFQMCYTCTGLMHRHYALKSENTAMTLIRLICEVDSGTLQVNSLRSHIHSPNALGGGGGVLTNKNNCSCSRGIEFW